MKRQDRKTFERRYGPDAEEIIEAFEELEQYSRKPKELLDEFRRLERKLEVYGKWGVPKRTKEALQGYAKRLKINNDRGLLAKINSEDLRAVFIFEFSELDGSLPPTGPDNLGRRVYTGQTEFPGSNPGYHKMLK